MASTYTSITRLEKQADGENPNTWGLRLNQNALDLVDQAIGQYTSIGVSSVNVTLTANNGAADQARSPFIELIGAITTSLNVVIPNVGKSYVVNDKTTRADASKTITLKTASGSGTLVKPSRISQFICDSVSVHPVEAYTSGSDINSGSNNTFTGTNIFSNTTAFTSAVSFATSISATQLRAGTLDGILGSGTPAAATVTQLTSGGAILSSTGLLTLDGSSTVLGGATYGAYVQDGALRAKGAGNTSSTYSLFLSNSDNTNGFQVRNDGRIMTGTDGESPYNFTTGSAANLFVSSNGSLYRSTSSELFKINIESIEDAWADKVLDLQPIYYKSTAAGDIGAIPENWTHYGFSAEQVATIDPRLVSYKTHEYSMGGPEGDEEISTELVEPIADGVQYTKVIPALVNLIKRQRDEIAALTTRVSALEV